MRLKLAEKLKLPLIIDERKGRKIAERRGIKIVGTLGVLLKAYKLGLIKDLNTEIEKLVKAGIRIDIIMKLKTAMLKEEEKYRGVVRIIKSVGIQPGEYVLISGNIKTAAKVWTKSGDEKLIWLDEVTVENVGIEIGNYVEVERFKPAIAKKVVLVGEELSECTWIPRIITRNEEDLIKLALKGRVLSVGEVVAVRGLSTDISVFYEVLETDPSGFVVVSDNTEVRWCKS